MIKIEVTTNNKFIISTDAAVYSFDSLAQVLVFVARELSKDSTPWLDTLKSVKFFDSSVVDSSYVLFQETNDDQT